MSDIETTIVTALRVAAEEYTKHADFFGKGPGAIAGSQRLAQQFERQAKEARELAERIDADGFTVACRAVINSLEL